MLRANRVWFFLLLLIPYLAAGCSGVPRVGPFDGDLGELQRISLSTLLVEVYTGRQPDDSQSLLPFDVARNMHVVVDAQSQRLTLFLGSNPVKTYNVAVGKTKTPTPIGHWRIKKKDVWAGGFGERWMGLNVPWGTYGIHGTNKPWSIGTRASAGCIRMNNRDVIEIYRLVSVGTPVTVKGEPFYRYGEIRRTIRPTHIGSDVAQLQRRLADEGLYTGPIDGKFGRLTGQAVREYQRREGLEATGIVGPATYERLGLVPLEDDPELRPGS